MESVVENVIKKQLMALTGLKTSVEETAPASEEPAFVEERLNLLEDASHRQLEIMESLIDAVQKLDAGGDRTEERLRVLERIAENQNLMFDKLAVVRDPPTLRSTSTTTTSLSGFPGAPQRLPKDLSVEESQFDSIDNVLRDHRTNVDQRTSNPRDQRTSSPSREQIMTSVPSRDQRTNVPRDQVEPESLDREDKQRLILDQMERLHTHLVSQQKQAHEESLEAQREAVRDEMEKMAEALLSSRHQENRQEAMAKIKPELARALGGGKARPPRKVMNPRVVAWHQRFVDNFKLRQLQSRAMRLNTN